MKFFNGSALVGTQGVTGTTTTYVYKAATLPAGTNRLTAVYSGGNGFNGSTSAALTYDVTAVPSVTVLDPAAVHHHRRQRQLQHVHNDGDQSGVERDMARALSGRLSPQG